MIAKYRQEGHPDKWWLTDFTMGQVEGRLADLEKQNEEMRNEISAAKSVCGGFVNDPFDGSLSTAIQAISMRCGAAERRVKELEQELIENQAGASL